MVTVPATEAQRAHGSAGKGNPSTSGERSGIAQKAPRSALPSKSSSRAGGGVPKRRKYKPGVRALKEIRSMQKSHNPLVPMAPFKRLVREIIQLVDQNKGYRISAMTAPALREAAEAYVTRLFENANLLAIHAKRVTLMPKDITLALRVRD